MTTTPFTTSEEGGIVRPLTIDGVDFDIAIASLSIDAVPISDSVDTIDGGSVMFQPSMPGGPNLIDRYTISFPVDFVRGASRKALERIRARGGYHTLAFWKPISAFYTVADPAWPLLLPQYRQNAAQLFAGLVSSGVAVDADSFPFLAWRNGAPVSATCGTPNTSGQTAGYVPFSVGALAAGDVVEIEFFPAFLMVLTAPRINYPQSITESFSYTFRER